jgi:exopolyphosphatase/pppGpp-phosphohydrolase
MGKSNRKTGWEKKKDFGIMTLARKCRYDEAHSLQVTRLSLKLFDDLSSLHRLTSDEKFLLECAGLLHDIGWVDGQIKHHKTALKIILESPLLKFDERTRLIVGSVARYHRKGLPKEKHAHYAALNEADKKTVDVLSAILRVADGLDRTHTNLVKDISCEILSDEIIAKCTVNSDRFSEKTYLPEMEAAFEKSDLFEKVFQRKLVIRCSTG